MKIQKEGEGREGKQRKKFQLEMLIISSFYIQFYGVNIQGLDYF